ncbi:uncharacterized protein [Pseudorasbora parva]|uniref:uncharacterized protein n=1 Tax=Pseudorasbora parva TaxID=51549 RepID=UPI00351EDDD8
MSVHDESTITLKEDANDLQNTVIDWRDKDDDGALETASEDSSLDDDYIPPICMRTGGGKKTLEMMQKLPFISLEETVLLSTENDVPPQEEDLVTSPSSLQVLCEDDVIGQKASIVYHLNLKQLVTCLKLPVLKCNFTNNVTNQACQASAPFEVNLTSRGTGTIIEWICSNGHKIWKWNSQPTLKYGIQAGDFMMATNVLLSGNNYYKVSHLFKYMNMGFVGKDLFFNIQDTYCVGTIREFWEVKRSTAIQRLQDKDSVVVLADGRMDSPGHCAQYCTYTTMENESKEIISVVTISVKLCNYGKRGFCKDHGQASN